MRFLEPLTRYTNPGGNPFGVFCMRELHHIVPKMFGGTELISLSPSAHAIITIYQCQHYDYPLLHRRQVKYLPEELKEEAAYWMSRRGSLANKMRKNTSRSESCKEGQRAGQVRSWSVDLARAEKTSAKMTETNSKKQPCPNCGAMMNAGNLAKHLKGKRCPKYQG